MLHILARVEMNGFKTNCQAFSKENFAVYTIYILLSNKYCNAVGSDLVRTNAWWKTNCPHNNGVRGYATNIEMHGRAFDMRNNGKHLFNPKYFFGFLMPYTFFENVDWQNMDCSNFVNTNMLINKLYDKAWLTFWELFKMASYSSGVISLKK